MSTVNYRGEQFWRRMERAVEKVRQRLERAAKALQQALVRMKLTSYRRKDQVHLLDLIDVELIDESWPARFPPECSERLTMLLEDPDG